MRRLLVAVQSDFFADALKQAFQNEYEVRCCTDGCEALELIHTFRPYALILSLCLPRKDGLTVLRQAGYRPPVILAYSNLVDNYACQKAMALGAGQFLLMPNMNAVKVAFSQLCMDDAAQKQDPEAAVRLHLHSLNFPTHLDGYRFLCVGLPLFAQDPSQSLSKILYPAIAKELGYDDWRSVERSIRSCIEQAWKNRDPAVWAKYFPPDESGQIPCPTNLKFLRRLAEMM